MTVLARRDGGRIRGPVLVRLPLHTVRDRAPFEEGLQIANEQNRVVASNKRLDEQMVKDDKRAGPLRFERSSRPFWSGTIIAYNAPGKKLGKRIEVIYPGGNRWIFAVPEAHQDRREAALVAKHPYFTLEVDGRNRVVHATRVALIKRFPTNVGWYFIDPVHGIPIGRQLAQMVEGARYLNRAARLVGPIPREISNFQDMWIIPLNISPSCKLGMLVEAQTRFDSA